MQNHLGTLVLLGLVIAPWLTPVLGTSTFLEPQTFRAGRSLIAFTLQCQRLTGPRPVWNLTIGDEEAEEIWDILESPAGTAGSVLKMAGFAVSDHDFSEPFGRQFAWFWVPTDDPSIRGWVSCGGNGTETAYSLAQTPDGWTHVVGFTDSLVMRTAGRRDVYLESEGPGQMWNPDSTYGRRGDEVAFSVANCSDRGLVIAGSTDSFGDGDKDVWLLHTDPNNFHTGSGFGNKTLLLWNQTYGGAENDEAYSVVVCSSGGYALAGYTESYGAGDRDAWLIRTDGEGHELWNHTYGGLGFDEIHAIIECDDGSFALFGTTRSYGAGSSDAWLIRTTSEGQLLSSTTFGGQNTDVGYDLTEVSDGGFLLIGYTNSFGAGSSDMWVLRVNPEGNILWQRTFGGPQADEGRAVLETRNGGYALAGITWSFGDGSSDVWVIRLPEDRPPTWVEAPFAQLLLANVPLRYELHATDSSGLGRWWLNDTTRFAVDKNGVVSNAAVLEVGVYGVQVCVEDIHGNVLTGTFQVTVVPLLLTIRPEFWVILVIAITIGVLPFVYAVSRRLRAKPGAAA